MPTRVQRSDIDVGNFSISSASMRLEWIYKVAGDFNELTCRTAVDDTTGLAVPALDSEHPLNSNLIVSDVSVDRVGYSPAYGPVFDVRVSWQTSIGTSEIGPSYTEYQWDFEEESETIDHDVNGRAFINANYDPVTGGYQITRQIITLKVWRQEPVFDVTRAYMTQGRVNENALTVLGETVPKSSMILWSYRPTNPLRVGQTGPVKVEYLFKFKQPRGDLDEPWQAQFQNVGYNGYAASGALLPFRSPTSKDYVTEPIPLAPTGLPLYGSYKVGPSDTSPVAVSASEVAAFVSAEYPKTIVSDTSPAFYKLIFKVRNYYDFQGFITGIM